MAAAGWVIAVLMHVFITLVARYSIKRSRTFLGELFITAVSVGLLTVVYLTVLYVYRI